MQATANPHPTPYRYGPLVLECRRRGIGRTMAYDLQKRGLIETFRLGTKRMVMIDSLDTLPERLHQPAANGE